MPQRIGLPVGHPGGKRLPLQDFSDHCRCDERLPGWMQWLFLMQQEKWRK